MFRVFAALLVLATTTAVADAGLFSRIFKRSNCSSGYCGTSSYKSTYTETYRGSLRQPRVTVLSEPAMVPQTIEERRTVRVPKTVWEEREIMVPRTIMVPRGTALTPNSEPNEG